MRSNIFKGPYGLRAGWRILLYVFAIVVFGFGPAMLSSALLHSSEPDPRSPYVNLAYMAVMAAVILFAGAAMGKFEHRTLADYGFPWRAAFGRRFWQGWAVGLVSLAALLLFLRLAGVFSFGAIELRGTSVAAYALVWFAMVFCAAIVEEFLYRGYIQFTLAASIGFWPAALLTSAFMAAMHLLNPGWTFLGIATVWGFGMVACLLLQRTGNLWMPIGLHVAWNWGEAYLFGIPCSGQMGEGSLCHGSFHGAPWITGMPFGVEAGGPAVVLLVLWWLAFSKWLPEINYPLQEPATDNAVLRTSPLA